MNSHELIEEAWRAKINLDYEQSFALLVRLKQTIGLPPGKMSGPEVSEILKRNPSSDIVEVLLLTAANARARNQLAYADELMGALDDFLESSGQPKTDRFYYERGMGAFVKGDFHRALEEFLRAGNLATSDLRKLWVLGDALFCMENLGLPFERTLKQVRELTSRLRDTHDLQRVDCQLRAFELRSLYRCGKFEEFFDEMKEVRKDLDQAKYFSYWVTRLPYHAFHDRLAENCLEEFSTEDCNLHHPFFKLRTLQGMLHPDDMKVIKPSDWIDRVYLWVWMWLQDSSAFPVQRVLAAIREIDWSVLLHRCTVEDSQLLRNALGWLGLFDSASERTLREVFSHLQVPPGHEEYAVLKLENHVIEYFLALRNGDRWMSRDFRLALEKHRLWKSKDLGFRQLVEAVTEEKEIGSEMSGVARMLRELLSKDRGHEYDVVVDMARSQVLDGSSDKKIMSEAACAALHLLKTESAVPCERFVQVCFGFHSFDPLSHNGKIFNLLARLKAFCNDNPKFRVKAGRVIAEGNWDSVLFRQRSAPVELLPTLQEWLGRNTDRNERSVARRTAKSVLDAMKEWDWSSGLSRHEVEGLLETPRSTTNRILSSWVKRGIVAPKGRARNIRYFLTQGERQNEVSDKSAVVRMRGLGGHVKRAGSTGARQGVVRTLRQRER